MREEFVKAEGLGKIKLLLHIRSGCSGFSGLKIDYSEEDGRR